MVESLKKISNLQFLMMIIGFVTPFGHFVYIALVIHNSGRDAWISFVVSALIGLGIVYIQFKLANRKPNCTLITESIQVLGKIPGSITGMIYILFFLLSVSVTIQVFILFAKNFFPKTPSIVLLYSILFIAAYAVHSGLEVLARTIQFFLPILMMVGILASIFITKEKDISELLPIMGHGFFPVWQGSIIFIVMFSELIIFRMMVPYANQPYKLPKQSIYVICIVSVMFLGPVTGVIMVYGESVAKEMLFPTFNEVRYISVVPGIIERFDTLGLFLWILGSFFRISIFLFGAASGISDLLNAKRDSVYVFPVTILVAAITQSLHFYTIDEIYRFLAMGYSVIALFVGIAIPFFVFFVDLVKRYGQRFNKNIH